MPAIVVSRREQCGALAGRKSNFIWVSARSYSRDSQYSARTEGDSHRGRILHVLEVISVSCLRVSGCEYGGLGFGMSICDINGAKLFLGEGRGSRARLPL